MKKFDFNVDSSIDKYVRIQGTNYDRKRKVTKSMKRRMEQMYGAGKSYTFIANHFGVDPKTVRYNLDESFKKAINAERNNYARNWVADENVLAERADYKRTLIKDRNFRRNVGISAY